MKIILVFASASGNTEQMGEVITNKLKVLGLSIDVYQIDYDDIMANDLTNYDAILFGTYTWGDGELPFEVEDFYEDLADEELLGKQVALFGSCDSFYPAYGAAIDLMAEQFRSVGAEVVQEALKVDLTPDEQDVEKCEQFAETFARKINAIE